MTTRAAALLVAISAGFPSSRFVVALSGGADSAVLAWLSAQLPAPAQPRAVFVHHGWEGSGRLQRAAEAVAHAVGLPLEVVSVAATTTEGEARRLRLEALETAAGEDPIVTAHHRDDVAETVLSNMARGAGAAGRAGIPGRRGRYFRPLLTTPRAELRTAADELGLPYVDDPANDDRAHARNVIRHDVLPRLEAAVPDARAGLGRSARLAAADDELLERTAATVPVTATPGGLAFPAAAVTMLPVPVVSRVVREVLRRLRPPYAGDGRQVAAVMAAATGAPVDLGGGLRAVREGPMVSVVDVAAFVDIPSALDLAVPGEACFGHHRLTAKLVPAERIVPRGRHLGHVDEALSAALTVRASQAGERIDIGTGHKLVSDALSEAAVPPRLRPGWPLVVAHGKIVWIAGVRLAAWSQPPCDAPQAVRLTTEMRQCSNV